MDIDQQHSLERAIDRELKALPPRKAPATLIPSVLAALRADALRPWWRKAWPSWPRRVQVLAMAAGVVWACAVAGWAGWAWLAWAAEPLARFSTASMGLAETVFTFLDILLGAAGVLARRLGFEFWGGLGLAAMSAWWICVGAGCWCYRQVRGHSWEQH